MNLRSVVSVPILVSLRLKRSEDVARKLNCACAKREFTACKVDTVRFHFLNASQLLIFLCTCLNVYIEFVWRYGQCGDTDSVEDLL